MSVLKDNQSTLFKVMKSDEEIVWSSFCATLKIELYQIFIDKIVLSLGIHKVFLAITDLISNE